ncbi:hypothetical protein BKA70DRAFT_1087006, partial [Coprinopsis sp. MPI-PUGE-AT-0042]
DGILRMAPPLLAAEKAREVIVTKLKGIPHQSRGYKHDDYDPFLRPRLEGMRTMLMFYTHQRSRTYGAWGASALQSAVSLGQGRYCVRQLAKLCRAFIEDQSVLPINPYGDWNETMLVDEDLVSDLNTWLQSLGKDISAAELMGHLRSTEVKEKHGITRDISERTARRYLHLLGYRWTSTKKGQYVDGHERDDVVKYRKEVYLPKLAEYQERTIRWSKENDQEFGPALPGRRVIIWYHDETIYYANDRRKVFWVHSKDSAKPYAKGEGASLMIADFISADFGFLSSLDGTKTARI